ncbi:MAG: xanthine dehydrogenase family protein molybdopterin-binding subunit, partial [Dehalococcoidia bacterium]|nr:xanthine dehydrogenase family protein molybdopterin-binding subunit [Dehalococcoidia bacterium]
MTTPMTPNMVGQPIKRREDPRLITGGATYTDDVRLINMLYLEIVRSPYAHARIVSVDATAAKALPGVVAVYTAADVKHLGPLPSVDPVHYVLADGEVKHVGDPVVAVVATSRGAARDAAMAIQIDYEALPAAVDVEKALEPNSPKVHAERENNVNSRFPIVTGDVDGAFAQADRVVTLRLVNQRVFPMMLEPRATVAMWEPGPQKLTMWVSTQIPHIMRRYMCDFFGLPDSQVRVIAPEVGGGFGAKLNVYPDEVLTAYAARKLGKPVKYVEDRTANFLQTTHGRDQIDYIEGAVKNDGTLLGLRVKAIGDLGAYLGINAGGIHNLTGLMMPGSYKVQNYSVEVISVFTNKTPTDAYRGAGRPEGIYNMERLMDAIAFDLGLDPTEVRKRNYIGPDQFPYSSPSHLVYDSGNYQAAMDMAKQALGYDALRAEQAEKRAQGKLMGIGITSYVELCGAAPSAFLPWGGWESATVQVEISGRVTVLTGISPHGQGTETSFAQIVADELGVAVEDVAVVHGDTDRVHQGIGTFGSRAMAVGGSALVRASAKVREKAQTIAAAMLEADPGDISFENGRYQVKGAPARSLTLKDIAAKAYYPVGLPADIEPGLEGQAYFEPVNFTFPFGTHCAVVDIDPDTGKVTLQRFLAVDDAGRIINPLLLEGQIHGGIAQGVAQALLEEVVYDEFGQLITGNLMDYAIPKADDLPSFELHSMVTP